MESNKVFDQKDQVLLTKWSNNSTSVPVPELTSTSTCRHGFFYSIYIKS